MQQLSAQDASFIYSETPNAHMHIAMLSLYDQSTAPNGRVRFRDILRNVERRLHLAKCFRRRLIEVPGDTDHPYWIEDKNFDLEFHVRHVALPPPGDWTQFCRQAARLHSYPLDRSKPLWEMTVISGLRAIEGVPESAFGLLLKIHHAAIDGASGAALTEVLNDLQATPGEIPPPQTAWSGEPEPASFDLMSRSALNNLLQPFRAAEVWSQTVPALRRAAETFRSAAVDRVGPVPRTRFNGRVTPHRVFDGRRYDLEDCRRIKRAVEGATINDVILTVVGGALRRYLTDKGELPDTSLIAMAPINVRTTDEKNSEGNKVAGMLASLGTHIGQPADRLAAVRDSTHNSKLFASAIGARLMTDYSHFIPARVAALAARLYTSSGMAARSDPAFNCVVTNVPGPATPLYMSGARLDRTFGMGPISDGVGLIFPVFSYCGGITVSVCGCRETLPDPERLAANLDDSFDELKYATT
jgi:diacylglycerol O-acyltransferase / wax synthase